MRVTKFVLPIFLFLGSPTFAFEDETSVHPSAETDKEKALKQGWVPAIPANKHWNRYLIMPWQFQTDVLKDHAHYSSINIDSFHIDHGAGKYWLERLDFAVKKNWPFYLDHACGKGILHLKVNLKDGKGLVARPHCLADPATIQKLKDIMTPRIKNMMKGPAVAYAFDDEVSLGSFCSPVEVDANPASIAAYRKWLENQYAGDIANLNKQYGTEYKSFGEVKPTIYEDIRGQFKADSLGKINISAWSDWRSYMDTELSNCLKELTVYCNSIDPTVPAGFVGGQQPSPWGGYNYAKLRKSIQFIESYDIGASNEILLSLWPQTRHRTQTWGPGRSPKDFKTACWSLWYYMVHGNRGAIVWPAGMFVDKDGKRDLAEKYKQLGPVFKEIQGPVSKKIIDGTFKNDPIAIYYSHRSIQLSWALDAHVHGGTWLKRWSSMDNKLSTGGRGRIAWLKTLEDLGYQAKFVCAEDVRNNILLKDKYKVLIMPRTLCLSKSEAEAIRAFAAGGGMVIADHLVGLFDSRGKSRGGQGILDDLFGIKHNLSKGIFAGECLTEINGEKAYGRIEPQNMEHGLSLIIPTDLKDPVAFAKKLINDKEKNPIAQRMWTQWDEKSRTYISKMAEGSTEKNLQFWFYKTLNQIVQNRDFYRNSPDEKFKLDKNNDVAEIFKRNREEWWQREVERVNRRILEAAFPGEIKIAPEKPFAPHIAGMAACERDLIVTGKSTSVPTMGAAKTRVVVRKKNAIYLNLSPLCYLLERNSIDGQKWRELVGSVLMSAELKPRCFAIQNGQKVDRGVEFLYWDNGGTTTLCVIGNYIHKTKVLEFSLSANVGDKPEKMDLQFSKKIKNLKNERTGKVLGDGQHFTISFKPWEASVFTYTE